MNLFVLSLNPRHAAMQNCDKHVCKIILEAADMMCLAHWHFGFPSIRRAPKILREPRLITNNKGVQRQVWYYRPQSQSNNHVSIWVRTSLENYRWTCQHALALCDEYERRYTHNLQKKGLSCHSTRPVIEWFAANEPPIPITDLTPFRQAVAEDCYNPDVVKAYRDYYVRYKARFAKWRLGNQPSWFTAATNK
jgi:hypothetical protein